MALGNGWAVRRALRMGLAHHPLCSHFGADVFKVGPVHVCRGCVLALPMFAVGAVAGWVAVGGGASPWPVSVVGLVCGVPQVVGSFVRVSPRGRALVKLTGGFGLGLLIVGILLLPIAPVWRVIVMGCVALSFVALQLLRALRILAACRRCSWAMDWDRCPGFGGLWEPFSTAPGVLAPGR